MERFKAIEKEMKTKAYSTVGLISHSKLDPREQQRLDLVQWLQGKVEELQQQVETSEAELETLQAGTKKKGKAAESGQARQTTLETLNEHRNWHISQLEIILRLVENASLKVDDVEAVKEDVDFFVTQNSVRWYS
jgi:CCR4-NOT transcription complex subunit 3